MRNRTRWMHILSSHCLRCSTPFSCTNDVQSFLRFWLASSLSRLRNTLPLLLLFTSVQQYCSDNWIESLKKMRIQSQIQSPRLCLWFSSSVFAPFQQQQPVHMFSKCYKYNGNVIAIYLEYEAQFLSVRFSVKKNTSSIRCYFIFEHVEQVSANLRYDETRIGRNGMCARANQLKFILWVTTIIVCGLCEWMNWRL